MKIYLTAVLIAHTQHREKLALLLEDMVEQTREEPACERYDLHQAIDDPNVFVFYEIWHDQDGLDIHNAQPYIKNFRRVAGDFLQEPAQIIRMSMI